MSLHPQIPRIAIILLAAGEGVRLGCYPKGLLIKDGVTLIERFWAEASQLQPSECITVLGFYAEQMKPIAELYSKVVIHSCPELGQSSSVRAGLEALQSDYDYVLIALVDQPRVGLLELETLIAQASHLPVDMQAIVPCCRGQRGNPVVFRQRTIKAILATPNQGCREWLDHHPDRVIFIETDHEAYIRDVDDISDLKRENVHMKLS